MKKRVFGLIIFISLLLILCACNKEEVVEETDSSIPVEVQIVEKGSISSENSVSGQTVSGTQKSAYFPLSARCIKVNVDVGDTVTSGQVICTVDLSATLSSYETAQMNYQNAVSNYDSKKPILEDQLAQLEKNLTDTQALFEIGAASQMEVDNAQRTLNSTRESISTTLDQLQLAIQNAKSAVDQLDASLTGVDRNGNICAPISGTVTALSAAKDSFVSPGVPVVTVESTSDMEVSVGVSESLVAKLSVGERVDVSLSSVNVNFKGTIAEISQSPNGANHLYTVTIKIPSANANGLRSGIFADVTFYTNNQRGVVIVPTEAIQTGIDGSYVYTVGNGIAHKVDVETGLVGDGVTEITSGLSGGETLVTVGQFYLSEGATVRVVSSEV